MPNSPECQPFADAIKTAETHCRPLALINGRECKSLERCDSKFAEQEGLSSPTKGHSC
jgi:hypothetical protein